MKTPWILSDSRESWTWHGLEGKPVVIEVYAPGDTVELLINGKSLGKKTAGVDVGYRVLYETTYEPGELVAISYQKGVEASRYTIRTTGEAERLSLVEDVVGNELVYLDVNLLDKDGNTVVDREQGLTIDVTGADLVGFGSANPKTKYGYCGTETETYQGRAQAILKKTGESAGVVKVTSSDGLSAEINLTF